MPTEFDTASLEISTLGFPEPLASVTSTFEALDKLVVGSLLATMAHPELRDDTVLRARTLLEDAAVTEKARRRFYPSFGTAEPGSGDSSGSMRRWEG